MPTATLTRVSTGLVNLPAGATRTYAALITEAGAGTYNFDVFLPAYSVIQNLGAQAIAVWDAATSAVMQIGDYAVTTDSTTGVKTVGAAIDLDGFFINTDVKATDLTAAQSISLLGGGQGGEAGAYNAGSNTHWNSLTSSSERWLRFAITSVGAGTAGRTYLWATVAYPLLNQISQA